MGGEKEMDKSRMGKERWILFIIVSLGTFLLYFITTAPTVVFWDVGEFLSVSYILGIPHPPGTPLYVILGRFMALLPIPVGKLYSILTGTKIYVEPVLKITLISMLCGGFTAGLVFLIITELLEKYWKSKLPLSFTYISAIFGALIGAVARTVWFNSVEAETYSPSVFVIVLLVYLWLRWFKKKEKDLNLFLFTIYFLALTSGIHLMSLIVFPAIFVFVWVINRKILWDKNLIASFVLLLLFYSGVKITVDNSPFHKFLFILEIGYLIGYLYSVYKDKIFSAEGWLDGLGVGMFIIGVIIGLVGVLFSHSIASVLISIAFIWAGFFLKAKFYKSWKGIALLLFMLGFSAEFYLMVRARHKIYINESEPTKWKSFWDVLMRKQYEPFKILPRRIIDYPDRPPNKNLIDNAVAFFYQILIFFRYFSWQYKWLFLIIVLGLGGIITHFFEDRRGIWLVGGMLLISTLGLIAYLNLKDSPTQPVWPGHPTEVRDRDYFFAPAYTFFALYAGIGLWAFFKLALENLKNKILALLLGSGIAAFLVAFEGHRSYKINDRHKNYIAEDYTYNLLISPEKNPKGGKVILFTNGDNDTFPLWFCQTVLGIRKDIINANLALLRTNWYAKQLKTFGAPIEFTFEEIDSLPPAVKMPEGLFFLDDLMIREMITRSGGIKDTYFDSIPEPFKGFVILNGVRIPKIYFAPKETFKKFIIEHIKEFKTPIYFSITCDPEKLKGWKDHTLLQGMAYKIVPQKLSHQDMETPDIERCLKLYYDNMNPIEYAKKHFLREDYNKIPPPKTFRYRAVFDKEVYKDDTHSRLLQNYSSVFWRFGVHCEMRNLTDKAIEAYEFGKYFLESLKPFMKFSEETKQAWAIINYKLALLYMKKNKNILKIFDHIQDFFKKDD